MLSVLKHVLKRFKTNKKHKKRFKTCFLPSLAVGLFPYGETELESVHWQLKCRFIDDMIFVKITKPRKV